MPRRKPNAEALVKASRDKAEREVTLLQARLAKVQADLAAAILKRDTLAAELTELEAL